MRGKHERIFTSKTLASEHVGLEEIDNGIWSLYHGPVLLARFRGTGDEVLWLTFNVPTGSEGTTRGRLCS